MKNVLVTGGAGYIGSHACKALSKAGYRPIAYDSMVHGHDWAVRWGPLAQGDITDASRLDEVFRQYAPFAVIHFAAFAYVEESTFNPAKYYQNNVFGTLQLLNAMRRADVNQLVFSSSCATYGTPENIPIAETATQRPINPYGLTKLMCEQMIADYCNAHDLSSIALRFFNAAGADPEGELGEDHDPETHLIPLVLQAAAGRRPHVTVFGNDYDTPDGTCIRDYIHVSDLADAHVAALEALDDSGWRAFNLGTGSGISVAELIEAAGRITGRPVPHVIGPRRAGDPAALVANAKLATQELQWHPFRSSISEILSTAWNWMSRKAVQREPMSVAL